MQLTGSAFQEGGGIPDRHSKQGGNISPALKWTADPANARSLALIVDDPDAPSSLFVHWLLYNISPKEEQLQEHQNNSGELADGARQGRNGFGDIGYGGPQPPSGTHRYYFHLHALDTGLNLAAGCSRQELDAALRGHVLETAQLMGRYQHREKTRTA